MEDGSSIQQVDCQLGMKCTKRESTCKKIHRSDLGEVTLTSKNGSIQDRKQTIVILKQSDEEIKVPQTNNNEESINNTIVNDGQAENLESINGVQCPFDTDCNKPFCE